jgi:NDP-sugar pyrophosphorylase family protein
MKREVVDYIPRGDFFDITDLMEELIADGKKVFSYPHSGYWLDVGKHEDFEKAQEDIKHLNIQ